MADFFLKPARIVRYPEISAAYQLTRQDSAVLYFFFRKVKGERFNADFVFVAIASWIETTDVVDIKQTFLNRRST